jgi:hypothetical protein
MTSSLVNIDRSKSLYLLYWVKYYDITMSNNFSNISKYPEISDNININDFLVRVNEHTTRGLISQKNNTLELTNIGDLLLKISDFLARIFVLTGWQELKNIQTVNSIWSDAK